MALRVQLFLFFWLAGASLLAGQEKFWKAGLAKADVTPSERLWMAGYASRDKPAEGKLMSLWIKVLALEDAEGHRGVEFPVANISRPGAAKRRTPQALSAMTSESKRALLILVQTPARSWSTDVLLTLSAILAALPCPSEDVLPRGSNC